MPPRILRSRPLNNFRLGAGSSPLHATLSSLPWKKKSPCGTHRGFPPIPQPHSYLTVPEMVVDTLPFGPVTAIVTTTDVT